MVLARLLHLYHQHPHSNPRPRLLVQSFLRQALRLHHIVIAVCFEKHSDNDYCDWIECVCGKWIHEDCIEEVLYDADGKLKTILPKLCCLDDYYVVRVRI